jgi:hypothetical protein
MIYHYSPNCREEVFSEPRLPALGLLGNSSSVEHERGPGVNSPGPLCPPLGLVFFRIA